MRVCENPKFLFHCFVAFIFYNYNFHVNNKQEWINDILALSSLLSHHTNSDNVISSESRLIHSKFQRLFHFLVTDVYNEPATQALGDHISNLAEVDDALINLNRNATLKFRNYKQFREQRLASSNERRDTSLTSEHIDNRWTNIRQTISRSNLDHDPLFRSKSSLRYFVYWLLHSSFFKWFISIIICLDVVKKKSKINKLLINLKEFQSIEPI
ncbi:unnamed protein product [Rotaria sp. Silwood2]|nr:unnamed protein product [Rotaria sp. Silwood2]